MMPELSIGLINLNPMMAKLNFITMKIMENNLASDILTSKDVKMSFL